MQHFLTRKKNEFSDVETAHDVSFKRVFVYINEGHIDSENIIFEHLSRRAIKARMKDPVYTNPGDKEKSLLFLLKLQLKFD